MEIASSAQAAFGAKEMSGDAAVRFCDRCRLNVHNLTAMSPREAEQLILGSQRDHVSTSTVATTVIVTDNCPEILRPARNRVSAYAAGALLAFSWCLALSVSAQGLVAPVDPLYGQSNEVGLLADYGYDTARYITTGHRDFNSYRTFCFFGPRKMDKIGVVVTELLGLAPIPLLVHLAGTYMIGA